MACCESSDIESPTIYFSFGNLQRKPDIYFLETDTENYVSMPVFGSHVCPNYKQREICRSVEVGRGADTVVATMRRTLCIIDTQTEPDKYTGSAILYRQVCDSAKHFCSTVGDTCIKTKGPPNSEICIGIQKASNNKLSSLDPISTAFGNCCQNNSACDSSNSSSECSTDKPEPDENIAVNVLPEVDIPVRSSTPDSTQSASTNIPNPQPCSYVEMFKTRRKLEENAKKIYYTRRQHIPHSPSVDHQDDTSVHPVGIMTKARRMAQSTGKPVNKCQLKERGAILRKDLSRRGYPEWSESLTSSPQKEPWRRFIYSKHPPPKLEIYKGYNSSSRSQRKRRTSDTMEEKELSSSISHLNQVNGHKGSDDETGSKYRDLHAESGSGTSINKVRLTNESKKKLITSPRFCPDPELERIYGGTKQHLHNSQRKKRNVYLNSSMSNDPFQGCKTGERCPVNDSASTDQSYITHQDGPQSSISTKDAGGQRTLDAMLNDHDLKIGKTLSVKRRKHSVFRCAINGRHGLLKPISPLPEQETPVYRCTGPDRSPVSTDVIGNAYIKGILKSPTEKNHDNEHSPGHNSCSEDVTERRVRFEEEDFLDKSYEKREFGTVNRRYDKTPVGQKCTNVRPREQNHVGLTKSHNIETEHYCRLPGFTLTSPLHLGNVATIERKLTVIQHFRDVGDYDELYPGNGEATRWNGICSNWKPKDQIADIIASGQPALDNDRSSVSNVSNEESEGRASGDGFTTYGTVNRGNVEHRNGGGYQDDMPHYQYSCLMSDSSDPQADIHNDQSTSMSRDLQSTSLETSERQQKAIENLERALQNGLLHDSLSNLPIRYQGESTFRHTRNFNAEDHVDLIDMKTLNERVSTPRREIPPPPCTRYRNMYDYASKNNSGV